MEICPRPLSPASQSNTNCVDEFTSTFLIAMEAENSEAAEASLLVMSFWKYG